MKVFELTPGWDILQNDKYLVVIRHTCDKPEGHLLIRCELKDDVQYTCCFCKSVFPHNGLISYKMMTDQ